MAERKTEETTQDVADAVGETTLVIAKSILAAQERNLKFVQTTLTNAMELMKSHVEASRLLLQEVKQQQEAWQNRVPGTQTALSRHRAALSTQPEPSATRERYSETVSDETPVAGRGTALEQRADLETGSILVNTALGEGLVSARQFARDHGVGEAGRTAFKRQTIPTTKVEGDRAHYLSGEQRHTALSYWSEHHTKGFHPCGDPGCPCHALV